MVVNNVRSVSFLFSSFDMAQSWTRTKIYITKISFQINYIDSWWERNNKPFQAFIYNPRIRKNRIVKLSHDILYQPMFWYAYSLEKSLRIKTMMDLEKILLPVTNVFISLEDISYPLLFHLCCLIRRFMIHNQICDKDTVGTKSWWNIFCFLNFVVNCERGYMYIRGWKEGKSNELTLMIFEMSNTGKRFFETFF